MWMMRCSRPRRGPGEWDYFGESGLLFFTAPSKDQGWGRQMVRTRTVWKGDSRQSPEAWENISNVWALVALARPGVRAATWTRQGSVLSGPKARGQTGGMGASLRTGTHGLDPGSWQENVEMWGLFLSVSRPTAAWSCIS
jgi:hypothetical protein